MQSELSSLLKGGSLSSALGQALRSLEPRELVGWLVGSSPEPERVISQLLAAVDPEKLVTLLGSTLTGEPFVKGTVGQLASDAGTTPEALASDLNTTATQLPASAMALTAPLADGKTLGVLDGGEGVELGTLASTLDGAAGGPGGTGGAGGGTPGSGGGTPGGSGGSGGTSPAAPTVIVDMPAQPTTTAASGAKATLAKIRIVSRKVKGDVATLVVQVPAAGALRLTGNGVRSVREQADGPERLTLRAILTKARAASLRRRRHRSQVELAVSYDQAGGPGSSTAKVSVAFG